MELRQLRYFIVLAEELSFTRAAARLHIVQPALSQQIRDFEEELGTELFYRNKRNVALSEAGRLLLPEARQILEHTKHAAELMKRTAQGVLGRISIGYSSGSVLSGLLGAILLRYRNLYPEIELGMRQVYPDKQIDLLLRREIDVIFGMSNEVSLPKECRMQLLAAYPLHVAMSSTHRLARNQSIHVSRLQKEPFIAYSEPEDRHGEIFIESVLGSKPVVAHKTDNLLFIGVLVEAGLGLAIMPTVMLKSFTGGVTALPLEGTDISFKVVVISRKNEMEPAVENLIAIAEAEAIARASGGLSIL